MATVRQLIEGAYRLIQEVGEGMPMTAEQGRDGLAVMLDMLSSWSAEPSSIYTEARESFTLTAGQAAYTIGATGDFNTARPTEILTAVIKDGDIVLSRLNNVSAAELAERQSDTRATPTFYWLNGGYPLVTITFNCPPPSAYTLDLFSKKTLTTYTSLADTISLPPGYERAIRYNLARELAPEYGKDLSMEAKRIARQALQIVKARNQSNRLETLRFSDDVRSEAALNGGVTSWDSGGEWAE